MSVTGLKAPNCDVHHSVTERKLIRTTGVSSHQPVYQVASFSHLNDDREPMTRDRSSSSTLIFKCSVYVSVSLLPPLTLEEKSVSVKVYSGHFIYDGKRCIQ